MDTTEHNEKKPPISWADAHRSDAIEKYFIEPFLALPVHPVNEESFADHLKMLNIEVTDNPDAEQQVHSGSMKEIFLYRITEKRAKSMILELSPCLMFILSAISANPATIAMYLVVARHWATKNNTNSVSLQQWMEKIMPMGYPLEEDLKSLWHSVKVNNDLIMGESNLLDIASAYESIMPADTNGQTQTDSKP